MSSKLRYSLLFVVCATVSLVWFAVCVSIGEPDHAGRGGSLGVLLSFFVFFVRARGQFYSINIVDKTAAEFSSMFGEKDADLSGNKQLSIRIDALKDDLDRYRNGVSAENVALAASSAVSTFCWGFGDWIARAFQ